MPKEKIQKSIQDDWSEEDYAAGETSESEAKNGKTGGKLSEKTKIAVSEKYPKSKEGLVLTEKEDKEERGFL